MMLVGLAAACVGGGDRSTIWPPPDFEVQFEEFAVDGAELTLERRFRVRADGLAQLCVATAHITDPESGTTLPVWSRLAIYGLVPTCTRALARRVHRAGVLELEPEQGQQDGAAVIAARLRWQAFDRLDLIRSRGRVHGPMAEILAILAAHLPPGEQFSTPGVEERGLESVLRGVPVPRDDAAGALEAFLALKERAPTDPELILDAFALACHLGRREVAEQLLDQWSELVRAGEPRRPGEAVAAGNGAAGIGGVPRLGPAVLRRMLPDS